ISQTQIDFDPDTERELSMRKLLDDAHSSAAFGSLRLESLNDQGVGILAQLAITHHGVQESYFEEELAMPSSSGSQTLRAVGDGTGENSILAISSLTMTDEQHITITGGTENGVTIKKIKLAANQTRIVRPCTETRRDRFDGAVTIDFRNQDKDEKRKEISACGISIQTDGMPGELAAYGFVHHADDDNDGYFSALTFADPKMLNSSGFVYTGVPVGRAKMLPQANYGARLALANFGRQDATVTVQYASTSHGEASGKTIAPFLIPALSTKVVSFSNLKGDENLQNSFIVRSNALPGVVVSKLLSFSDGALREIEIIGKDEKQMENMGNHPWTVEDGVDSTLILFNHSGASQTFFLKIADQGKQKEAWRKDYKLASMETLAISLNDLIANRVKDDTGHVLSKDAKEGELVWLVPGSSEVTGRILQSDKILNMARNYSCGTCGFLCHDLGLSPFSSLATEVGLEGDIGAINPQYCNMPCQVPTSCPAYSNPTMAGSASYTWSGGGTIATLVSGGSSATSIWQGATAGFTTVTYSIKMTPSAPYQCTGNANVQVGPPIAQDHTLWYFNGNPTPTGFTLGSSGATLTASGGGNGTYVWTITTGTTKVVLENGSNTMSKTNINTMGISSRSFSTAMNDVTIQLKFTPTGLGPLTSSASLTVDSPYKLVSTASTDNHAIKTVCTPPSPAGTEGFQSFVHYKVLSFLGQQISIISIAENFSNIQTITSNTWPGYVAGTLTTPDGTFVDNICVIQQTNPISLPPQSPLSSLQVDQAAQRWNVGSGVVGPGLDVQTDTLRRFVDHGTHAGITSPTR